MSDNDASSQHQLPKVTAAFKLTISVTARCNLACRHCYADCGAKANEELTTEEWLRFIDELIAERFITVFFEGGEPFVREDFETLLAHASPKMFVAIRTNGTLIDAARAARLTRLRIGRVYVDVMGATASTHDSLTGASGSFAAAIAGIQALREENIRTTLLTILNRENATELQAIVDLAQALGCDEVGVLRLYPLGRAKRNWGDLALSLDEMQSAVGSLTVPSTLRLMHSWHPNDANCCWQNAAVDPFGRSIGCSYLREYVDYGNIRDAPFRASWDHPLFRELRSGKVGDSCPDCTSTQLSRGGCRSTAYAFHGRWDAPDPFCAHLNRGVDLRVLPN